MTTMTGFRGIDVNTVTLFHTFTNEERQEDYETVALCFYNQADDPVYFDLKGKVKELVRIGDCVAKRDAQAAVREGEIAA